MPDALAAAYDVLLLDLDGVVYIGGAPIPGAPAALRRAQEQGAHLAYVTNNASRTPAAVAALLDSMDVPAYRGRRGHVGPGRGPPAGRQAPAEVEGPRPRRAGAAARGQGARPHPRLHRRRAPAGRRPGLQPRPRLRQLRRGRPGGQGGRAVRRHQRGLDDPQCARHRARQRLAAPGHRARHRAKPPQIAGKPEPPLHHESVIRTGARHPLVIGDRLDTDIEAAYNTGTDGFLVLTGVDGPRDAVPLAPPHRRPPTSPRRSTPCSSPTRRSPARRRRDLRGLDRDHPRQSRRSDRASRQGDRRPPCPRRRAGPPTTAGSSTAQVASPRPASRQGPQHPLAAPAVSADDAHHRPNFQRWAVPHPLGDNSKKRASAVTSTRSTTGFDNAP